MWDIGRGMTFKVVAILHFSGQRNEGWWVVEGVDRLESAGFRTSHGGKARSGWGTDGNRDFE